MAIMSPLSPSPQLHARALRVPTIQSFNHAIRSYTSISHHNHSLHLYLSMLHSHQKPNQFTFPFVLKSCISLNHLRLGLQIHACILKLGYFYSNGFCACAVLDLYLKLVSLGDALKVFDRIPENERSVVAWNMMIMAFVQNGFIGKGLELMEEMRNEALNPEISTWNSIIAGCVKCREIDLALHILRKMVSESGLKPNHATLNTLLSIIPSIPSSYIIKELHCFILKNSHLIQLNPVDFDRVISTLVSGYAHNELMDSAYRLFHQVRLKIEILYISMIEGFHELGQINKAFEIFREMAFQFRYNARPISKVPLTLILPKCEPISKKGLEIHGYAYRNNLESDTSISNGLMAMYAKRGNLDHANRIFRVSFEKDVVSWNTVISNYTLIDDFDTALKLFDELLSCEIKPDEYTFSCMVKGCTLRSYLKQGMAFHAQILKLGFYDSYPAVQNALMDAYGNCGCIEDAQNVFDEMKLKDAISWNTIISSHGFTTNPKEALFLFQTMQERGYEPNNITFTAILSLCSHAGLVQECLHFFKIMSQNYNITPDLSHYCCIVDCLSRVGQLNNALKFINSMPIKPDECIWGALLNGCHIHGDVELAEFVTNKLLNMDPNHSGYWILMSNTYADAFRWGDVSNVRAKMKETGLKKIPGFSCIENETGRFYRFFNGDKLHERSDEIYSTLDGLVDQLKYEGYEPMKEWILVRS